MKLNDVLQTVEEYEIVPVYYFKDSGRIVKLPINYLNTNDFEVEQIYPKVTNSHLFPFYMYVELSDAGFNEYCNIYDLDSIVLEDI